MIKINPIGDRVVVKPDIPTEQTKGGIILPPSAQEKPLTGEIIAIGKGKISNEGKLVPLEVVVGNKVLYGKYSGTEINLNDENCIIMRESDIYAVIG